jgi:hypothetical protein
MTMRPSDMVSITLLRNSGLASRGSISLIINEWLTNINTSINLFARMEKAPALISGQKIPES